MLQHQAKPDDKVEITEVTNPGWVATDVAFINMLEEFVKEAGLPSVNLESMHNYLCSIVQATYYSNLNKENQALNTHKFHAGFVNGKLCGFSMFSMLPNRMPHIQTIDWAICKSYDHRLTHLFAKELLRWKRKWNAVHIMVLVRNPKLLRTYRRLFKSAKTSGPLIFANGIHAALLKVGGE
jgi:hypothetical protein